MEWLNKGGTQICFNPAQVSLLPQIAHIVEINGEKMYGIVTQKDPFVFLINNKLQVGVMLYAVDNKPLPKKITKRQLNKIVKKYLFPMLKTDLICYALIEVFDEYARTYYNIDDQESKYIIEV